MGAEKSILYKSQLAVLGWVFGAGCYWIIANILILAKLIIQLMIYCLSKMTRAL